MWRPAAVKDTAVMYLASGLIHTARPVNGLKKYKSIFELGGHKSAALAMVQKNCDIYLVTDMEDKLVEKANMVPFHNLQQAVDAAFAQMGEKAAAYVVPVGGSTLPVLE